MPKVLTWVVELAVGVGCLGAAASAWRRGGARWIAALLAVAGIAAVGHVAFGWIA